MAMGWAGTGCEVTEIGDTVLHAHGGSSIQKCNKPA